MSILLVSGDLMMTSKCQAAATRAGAALVTALSVESALAKAAESTPRAVVLDLALRGLDPAVVMAKLAALTPRPIVIAFAPHVHEARLAAAQTAGCDLVLSRGQFDRQMDALFRQHAPGAD
ncbi:MAG: hypothetical protein K1X71_06490 [Pirellulales bacterium]|nr:hypothetical protein [Pirellulales bacterium]